MILNTQEGCFSEMMFTVGRLMGIKYFVGSKVICEANKDVCCLGIIRKVRGWTLVRELIFV